MSTQTKILIVEDELTNALLLKRVLSKAGYSTLLVHSGVEAMDILGKSEFDIVLTDWMMPQVDGIELIRHIRSNLTKVPVIIMITALVSESAKQFALESGADDYIAKPIDIDELIVRIKDSYARHQQQEPEIVDSTVSRQLDILPPFVAVGIATSTGGPPTLIEIFKSINSNINAVFFVVQHGPSWMLETFSQRLSSETSFPVNVASNGMCPEIGNIYIAPGDRHIVINSDNYCIETNMGPKENFVRPSADPLFKSIANAFGHYCVGVVLTGLGRDGAQGAAQISSVKGKVIIQEPSTAIAPSMPQTALKLGFKSRIEPLFSIGSAISETVFPLAANLKIKNQKT